MMRSQLSVNSIYFDADGDHQPSLKWDFPSWDDRWSLQGSGLLPGSNHQEYQQFLSHALRARGYVVVRFEDGAIDCEQAPFRITRLLSLLGKPIRVFSNEPGHWRVVDVDLSRPPNRSRGSGLLPLHMDFVNAENPPDLVCLLCMRSDPIGEGRSLIARHRGLEEEIDLKYRDLLRKVRFSDGRVENLLNVGNDANPFLVFANDGSWRFRYTGTLEQQAKTGEVLDALRALNDAIRLRQEAFDLDAGELLIVDQREALHGREPVGLGQEKIDSTQRRLVLHSFVKSVTSDE